MPYSLQTGLFSVTAQSMAARSTAGFHSGGGGGGEKKEMKKEADIRQPVVLYILQSGHKLGVKKETVVSVPSGWIKSASACLTMKAVSLCRLGKTRQQQPMHQMLWVNVCGIQCLCQAYIMVIYTFLSLA